MTYALLTLLSFLALGAAISVVRYRVLAPGPGLGYPAWLKRRTMEFLKNPRKTLVAVAERFHGWSAAEYPGWTIWVPRALFASIGYQAVSGIGAALFFQNGMRGIFLLLHMAVGALFAVSLALDLLLRAKDNDPCALAVPFSRFVFWIFMGCGILVTATATGSMMNLFTLRGQLTLIGVHRYVGTIMVLSAAVRFELAARK